MKRVSEKIALITGGGAGLGKAIAQRLIEEGAKVVITDIQDSVGRDTATVLGCDFLAQDVTNEKQWEEIIREVQKKHGALHILVNNAGVLGPMESTSPENTALSDWKKVHSVNVEGAFLGCRSAIPAMARSGGGSIINISSIAALVASPYATAYGASKAAVRHLTKSVAQHCAQTRSNIRCNSVHPGMVLTAMMDINLKATAEKKGISYEQALADDKAIIPQGEFIQPEDIANAVLFLASHEARYITGTKMIVDGGIVNCESFPWIKDTKKT